MSRVAQDIPKIGLVMEAVKVVRWLKQPGDAVTAGEPLLEVETEKSVLEIEAVASGTLLQILVQADQQATVGDKVAWIESDQVQPVSVAAQPQPSQLPDAGGASAAPPAPLVPRPAAESNRIRSTPVARKLAATQGLDLRAIEGSGPQGRIQLEDVRRAIDEPGARAPRPALTPMRRALARAMSLSNATVPQFSVASAVDWTAPLAARRGLLATSGAESPRPSLNDFLMQAVARALIELPALNATFSGEPDAPDACIVPASGAHIGLVVAVDNGLLVPVLHDVETLSLIEIARRRQQSVERGLNGRLRREDLDGATFSISNLGAQGPERFTALINPPQSAILAVGRQMDRVIARNGAAVVVPMSDLTLSVDHRVADGRLAAQFLARVIALLEGGHWRLQ